jgi:hypothetical protein
MPTFTGQMIADRAWTILNDTNGGNGVRWPVEEILRWINDGQREVVINLPSAYVKSSIVTFQAGTRQTMAGLNLTDGVQFMKFPRNFANDGVTPGRAVTVRPMLWLDEQRPNWHSDAAGDAIHYFFDPNEPKAFYRWPQANGTTHKGEIVYSAVPAELAAIGNTIVIDDIYANALQYYVLFRAMAKQSNYTKNPAATAYYQLFLQSLGIKDARVKALDANLAMLSDGAESAGNGAPAGG